MFRTDTGWTLIKDGGLAFKLGDAGNKFMRIVQIFVAQIFAKIVSAPAVNRRVRGKILEQGVIGMD